MNKHGSIDLRARLSALQARETDMTAYFLNLKELIQNLEYSRKSGSLCLQWSFGLSLLLSLRNIVGL